MDQSLRIREAGLLQVPKFWKCPGGTTSTGYYFEDVSAQVLEKTRGTGKKVSLVLAANSDTNFAKIQGWRSG